MKVKNVEIIPIKPHDGLIGFANVIVNDSLYLSSIGIHKKRDGNGFRLTYPTKKVGETNISLFHPLDKELSKEIERVVFEKAAQVFM